MGGLEVVSKSTFNGGLVFHGERQDLNEFEPSHRDDVTEVSLMRRKKDSSNIVYTLDSIQGL